jgi:endonuclease/exonuclease/phosphatase family metal-dependent hydrolase
MKGKMKKTIFRIVTGIGILLLLFLLFLLISTIIEFRPPEQKLIASPATTDTLSDTTIFSALIWNIGYAGLGANMDFFYDGGKEVRDTRENVSRNLNAIASFLGSNDTIDFILLQEIDLASKRSYRMNQAAEIGLVLGRIPDFIGINYKVQFVPVPPRAPMGKVKSGVITFSDYKPVEVKRYSYPGSFSWPSRTFNLKRCFLVCRYSVAGGKEFILVNTHNSAFDDGSMRALEIKALAGFVTKEYEKGNFVLIGGDWNQCPSGFIPRYEQPFDTIDVKYLPTDYLPGWKQIYPTDGPTNRRVLAPYDKSITLTTVIDFYIASPNIDILSLRRVDLDFANSDHQPVLISFCLRKHNP